MINLADDRLIEKIKRIVMAKRDESLRFSHGKQGDIKRLYRETAEEINMLLGFYADSDGAIGYMHLEDLMRDVRRVIKSWGRLRDDELFDGVSKSVLLGIGVYRAILPVTGGVSELEAVSEVVYRRSIEHVYNFVHPKDKLQLSDRLWRLTKNTRARAGEVIETAVIQGQSAREAAQRLIRGGERVPPELLAKMGLNSSTKIGTDVFQLFTEKGQKNVVHNALRLTRTELSGAHREAFLATGKEISSVVGNKWNLSPSHPKPDVCDTLASQDNYGLGPGGYTEGNYPTVPAHPECMCFETPIFEYQVV